MYYYYSDLFEQEIVPSIKITMFFTSCCPHMKGPQIMWVKGSPSEELEERVISPQVAQRLSIIAQILLVSSTMRHFSHLMLSRLARRPSLHFSFPESN